MIFQNLREGVLLADKDFDRLYPKSIRITAETHFTPVAIVQRAVRFLIRQKGEKILDIGSGAGKFCMIGSVCSEGHFTGIEQRATLHDLAKNISEENHLENLDFIHANIKDIDFTPFRGFYFFNAFYENILQFERIDDHVEVEKPLYQELSLYVKNQLAQKPKGTRLVTYFSAYEEVPDPYQIKDVDDPNKLTFWEKIR